MDLQFTKAIQNSICNILLNSWAELLLSIVTQRNKGKMHEGWKWVVPHAFCACVMRICEYVWICMNMSAGKVNGLFVQVQPAVSTSRQARSRSAEASLDARRRSCHREREHLASVLHPESLFWSRKWGWKQVKTSKNKDSRVFATWSLCLKKCKYWG